MSVDPDPLLYPLSLTGTNLSTTPTTTKQQLKVNPYKVKNKEKKNTVHMPIRICWKELQISGVEKPDRREIQGTSPGNTDGMPLFYTEDVKQ